MRLPLLLAAILPVAALHAQPANDDCANAALLCDQQPLAGTNVNAQGALPGFCSSPSTSNLVWYTFHTNSSGGEAIVEVTGVDCLAVPGMGNTLTVVVLSGDGSCTPGSFGAVSDCTSGTGDFTVQTQPLDPDTEYWVLVAGGLGGGTQHAQCTFDLTITGPGVVVPWADFGVMPPDTTIGQGESVQLTAYGGPPYTWSPTTGLSGADIANPIANPESTTIYEVSTTINGCTFSVWTTVEVVRRVDPPNTFTPNGDGINDLWLIPGIADYPGAEVVVHDRWGQRVFRDVGYREPWDGTNNGKDVPNGTYYYHIRLNQLAGRSTPYTGFISIVR